MWATLFSIGSLSFSKRISWWQWRMYCFDSSSFWLWVITTFLTLQYALLKTLSLLFLDRKSIGQMVFLRVRENRQGRCSHNSRHALLSKDGWPVPKIGCLLQCLIPCFSCYLQ